MLTSKRKFLLIFIKFKISIKNHLNSVVNILTTRYQVFNASNIFLSFKNVSLQSLLKAYNCVGPTIFKYILKTKIHGGVEKKEKKEEGLSREKEKRKNKSQSERDGNRVSREGRREGKWRENQQNSDILRII